MLKHAGESWGTTGRAMTTGVCQSQEDRYGRLDGEVDWEQPPLYRREMRPRQRFVHDSAINKRLPICKQNKRRAQTESEKVAYVKACHTQYGTPARKSS
jgi:hypothetical protein